MTSIVFGNVFDTLRDFDRIANSFMRGMDAPANGPAYDILRTDHDHYELVVAVPGVKESDLSVTVENGVLSVKGKTSRTDEAKGQWLYRGVGRGQFERRFALGEHVEVKNARLENGLLTIELAREVPEALKPRTIQITKAPAVAQVNAQAA
jgi:molecular chaperone IbpA